MSPENKALVERVRAAAKGSGPREFSFTREKARNILVNLAPQLATRAEAESERADAEKKRADAAEAKLKVAREALEADRVCFERLGRMPKIDQDDEYRLREGCRDGGRAVTKALAQLNPEKP